MQVDTDRFSWFQVPEDVKKLLILAAENWENSSVSEKYINQALTKTGEQLDVLVAAYRYFYYKSKYNMALDIANRVIDSIKKSENLSDNWEQVKPVLLSRKEDSQIRTYLNACAASGLVLAKLGEIEKAKEICTRVREIDNQHDFGAGLLFDILTRPAEEDE